MAELCFSRGHVGIICVFVPRPEAAKENCAATRGQEGRAENRASNAETAFLDGGLCSEPSFLNDEDLDDSRLVLEDGLHPLSTKVEPVSGIVRARVLGWGFERGCARIFVGFSLRPLSSGPLWKNPQGRPEWPTSSRKKAVNSEERFQIAREGEEQWPAGSPCCTSPLARDLFRAKEDKALVRAAQVTVPHQAGGFIHQVHGQEALCFVVVVVRTRTPRARGSVQRSRRLFRFSNGPTWPVEDFSNDLWLLLTSNHPAGRRDRPLIALTSL